MDGLRQVSLSSGLRGIVLEKLAVAQLLKKHPNFYGTLRFISACCIHTVHCHPVLLRFVLILFSYIATSYRRGFSPYTFRLKLCTHLSPQCVLHARCLPLLNLTSVIKFIFRRSVPGGVFWFGRVFLLHCRLLAVISVLEYW